MTRISIIDSKLQKFTLYISYKNWVLMVLLQPSGIHFLSCLVMLKRVCDMNVSDFILFINIYQMIILFKSLRNCKRRNKRNFTLWSNSNKLMLCGGILFQITYQRNNFIFLVSLQLLRDLNNIFHVKDLKRSTFYNKFIYNRIKIQHEKH